MITKEQRQKFINEYASRIVERAGWTAEDAMDAALAADVDQCIEDGYNGMDAADEEMSYWEDDGD
jgi:2-oxo-4-hydroxy-4-carboxy--5-ureidoimidazoline (OHCU) decarboxylase